ncbi:dihydrolipoamide acetyltransferase family protein [Enterococcus raffinosus]|uniref:Dihydrolipoamide acetyltransferase component of pyruvate dehydrogenase complex n=1 Tax=Enterococcus raffinosus TaxID=71452 RepID=A0AAW8T9N8_9ENTE|nr:dihydrolipoamide acetyltransferase family protein [Enterococcus raffinosus]MDT2523314.1 dihydrolipoamide acetyltransferase family protein [Enterococcus raffinosus]MDT2529299.1 dihydrolipoamide acetyltransferase family protein [Enterococcus raffinosus]MDT2534153.1 dihydrolipoamide acetyltransferase family protein [Enterococcus raffinosus]MDT2543465.1 dihydrolipoamide acetyltransferase family protein [Enterococcus raffinosus]MDT2555189.1 dihydrolipoamide acetyltransferase family protein [Ente
MANEVLMPKLSSTMDVGTITTWLKNEGDSVEIGEAIFEVMTDKIAIEVEAYDEGILLKKYIGDGDSSPVNSVIAYIGEAGEDVPAEMPGAETEAAEEAPAEETTATAEPAKETTVATTKVRATPAARRLAREKGINLQQVQGTGPKGRIQALDVKQYQEKPAAAAPTQKASEGELIPWSGMRKAIADKMSESKHTIPHVTMNAEVDLTKVIELRKQLLPMVEERTDERLSFLEIIAKAAMVALKAYPEFNANAYEDGIRRFEHVNLGVAVAVADGLVVPVVEQADQKGLSDLTAAVKAVTKKARDGQLMPAEMSGGTFTISSLGRSKVQTFNPIINLPEVAILGVGGSYDKLVVENTPEGPQVATITALNLCLSFDHRVADGAPAAAFLSMIVDLLENPMSLLL